jgi:hypothetical protein
MSPAWPASPPRPSRGWCTARTGCARPPGSGCSRPSRNSATCPTAPPRACPAGARTSSAWCAWSARQQQYDIENMNLLFYDEVLRGVEARIRDHEWSLLITFLQGANDPGFPRLESFSGKADGILIGEGIVPSPFIERLAARVPVVIFAGTPDEQAADVVTADNLSGSAAVVTHLIRDHGRRRLFWVHGPADSPDSRERRLGLDHVLRPTRNASSSVSTRATTACRAARKRARRCWPCPGRTFPTRSSPPTTRWPSGCSRRWPGPASGCRRTWPWSASTTSSPAACVTRRSPRFISRCACWASGPAPGCSIASPTRRCLPRSNCCPPSSCCGQAAAARPVPSSASPCRRSTCRARIRPRRPC